MMKSLYPLIVAIAVFATPLSGCMPSIKYSRAKYDISLVEAERPVHAKERYAEQKIVKVQEGDLSKYYFEDEMVKILWHVTSSKISFVLTNKTDHSIRIVWDEAAFVDEKGMSHRVIHSGVKYTDRNNLQPPTVVVRRGRIADTVHPTDYIYYYNGYYSTYASVPGGWKENPILPNYKMGESVEELKKTANSYAGKTFQVLLPLQIEGVVNDYIFKFRVNDVIVTRGTT